jgi:iron complex outermembrane recepter protein
VIAYETGYRAQPLERLYVDTTIFFNTYTDLQSVEMLPDVIQSNPPLVLHPETYGDKLHGTTDGVELAASWKATSRWTVSPGYSFLQMHLHPNPDSLDTTTVADIQGTNPVHQAQLRSHVELLHGFSWDAAAYFVDRLSAPMIASHTRMDTQLTWRLAESTELSFVGQDLLRDHHAEFNDQQQSVNSSQMKRSVYAKFSWRF